MTHRLPIYPRCMQQLRLHHKPAALSSDLLGSACIPQQTTPIAAPAVSAYTPQALPAAAARTPENAAMASFPPPQLHSAAAAAYTHELAELAAAGGAHTTENLSAAPAYTPELIAAVPAHTPEVSPALAPAFTAQPLAAVAPPRTPQPVAATAAYTPSARAPAAAYTPQTLAAFSGSDPAAPRPLPLDPSAMRPPTVAIAPAAAAFGAALNMLPIHRGSSNSDRSFFCCFLPPAAAATPASWQTRFRSFSSSYSSSNSSSSSAPSISSCSSRREGPQAMKEIEALGDLDSPYWTYEYHPQMYPGKNLRILCGLAPHICGSSIDSIGKLFLLLQHCKQQQQQHQQKQQQQQQQQAAAGESSRVWQARLNRVAFLLSLLLSHCNYPEEALRVLKDEVLIQQPDNFTALSLMGRLSLKARIMGCSDCAEQYFTYADCVGGRGSAASSTNHGLLMLFTRRVPAAVEAFEAAAAAASEAASLGLEGGSSQGEQQGPWAAASQVYYPSAQAVCCNNLAVAKLYNKNLDDATATLEGLVHGNPGLRYMCVCAARRVPVERAQSDYSLRVLVEQRGMPFLPSRFGKDGCQGRFAGSAAADRHSRLLAAAAAAAATAPAAALAAAAAAASRNMQKQRQQQQQQQQQRLRAAPKGGLGVYGQVQLIAAAKAF
ncbi:hypothetical protein ACSSS7_006821 [Eimeria intestinalis]